MFNLVKEMIPVLFGVLIALFINDWKAQQDDQRYIDNLMYSIKAEMQENKNELTDLIKEHQEMIDSINYYVDDDDITLGDLLNKTKGIRIPAIKNTAWKALANSRIELIHYDDISLLSDIDEGKNYMTMKASKLTDLIYEKIESSEAHDKQLFNISINDLLYLEEDLLSSHQQFLENNK